jgi:hypothetical protein
MLTVLSDLLIQIIHKIVGTAVDATSQNIARRRSLAAKLIDLFSALVEIQETSQRLHADLVALASGKEPVSPIAAVPMGRVMVGRSTDQLRREVKRFSDILEATKTFLNIYSDDDLSTRLEGMMVRKGEYLRGLDLLLVAVPELRNSDDLSTGYLRFPLSFPGRQKLSAMLQTNPDLEQLIHKEFNVRELNIHNQPELTNILRYVERDLARLQEARRELGQFIKNNLPLESVIQ